MKGNLISSILLSISSLFILTAIAIINPSQLQASEQATENGSSVKEETQEATKASSSIIVTSSKSSRGRSEFCTQASKEGSVEAEEKSYRSFRRIRESQAGAKSKKACNCQKRSFSQATTSSKATSKSRRQ